MATQQEQLSEEKDLEEASHEQLKQSEAKPIAPTTQEEILESEHDLDDEAHRQLEEGS